MRFVASSQLAPSSAAAGILRVASHTAARLLGQPLSLAMLAAAQLGVPVAAATVGVQLHVLAPGEPAALLLGALVTVLVTPVAATWAVRQGWTEPPPPVAVE